MTQPSAVDLAKLREELNALAEFLQAGGSPEELLETLQGMAQEAPTEEETDGEGATDGETPPETPPKAESDPVGPGTDPAPVASE